MSAQPDTYPSPAHGWTCFHCGETFTTQGGAAFHFGADPSATPGCMIKVTVGDERGWLIEIRKLEREVRRLTHDIQNEISVTAVYHESLARELQKVKPFAKCSTLQDVFNVWDSMEGRALAAEERLRSMGLLEVA
jgi:hypothetical protein